jgi:hypothetical protein
VDAELAEDVLARYVGTVFWLSTRCAAISRGSSPSANNAGNPDNPLYVTP